MKWFKREVEKGSKGLESDKRGLPKGIKGKLKNIQKKWTYGNNKKQIARWYEAINSIMDKEINSKINTKTT